MNIKNALRFGNLVNDAHLVADNNKVLRVLTLDKHLLAVTRPQNKLDRGFVTLAYEDIEGIQINKFWLHACGAHFDGVRWIINGLLIIENPASVYYMPFVRDCEPFDTVHELQNIYYAIKRTELKFKL